MWDLLRQAQPIDAPGEGAAGRSQLQHAILVRGQDGYAVAIAIGEIDPAFEAKQIILALPTRARHRRAIE